MDRPSEELLGEKVGGRFVIGEFVAGGSFGSFHFGTDCQTQTKVAIKLESKESLQPQLHIEYMNYSILGRAQFIPIVHYFAPCGRNESWNALVMDLLGPSLSHIREKCGGTFTVQTTINLMIQLLNIFEFVHLHGILYRDIKPENFLLGMSNNNYWSRVHLIDLGFCKRFIDSHNRHIPYVEGKLMAGTQRYVSVNNHLGRELGRRDDLEALLYMIIFLHKGQTPWQGLQGTVLEKSRQMVKIKLEITPQDLCSSMPPEFASFAKYVRRLQFAEMPRYREWWNRFRLRLGSMGFSSYEDHYLDWDRSHNSRNNLR
ncbi:hypothetical protein RDWZM_004495 [Blomia tropicalis]|uniref:non-specific serine/threonine protein kinase n=1 Tax=Blomia tropicalis TaxID=40697 RepID=A0A9Q0M4R7_BLOTA|nr:hypothetical protein RDWZM_004495 [Blomia tropicalis]